MQRQHLGGLPVQTPDEVADQIVGLLRKPAPTTVGTYCGPAITVESVLRAVEELRKLPLPPTEIRLHPDDLRELRLQLQHGQRVFSHGGHIYATSMTLYGLPVIEDPDAPRLPRKPE